MRGVWSRHGLLTKHERLLRLEKSVAERKIELSDDQIRLLERFSPEFRERHIETAHWGQADAAGTVLVMGSTSRLCQGGVWPVRRLSDHNGPRSFREVGASIT